MEATKEAGAAQSSSSGSGSSSNTDGSYDCNICLEIAHDPVVTLCGHLFCWPCLYRWLVSRSAAKECPVCKSAVEEAKVVPIYGRGKGSTDPRTKEVEIPNRPSGRRTDVPRSNLQQMGFSFFTGAPSAATAQFGNVTLSAGFGLFPFLFGFCTTGGFPDLNIGGAGTGNAGNGGNATQERHENTQDALLSRLLLFVGFFVVVCLLFF